MQATSAVVIQSALQSKKLRIELLAIAGGYGIPSKLALVLGERQG
jgi:hypothetical protein